MDPYKDSRNTANGLILDDYHRVQQYEHIIFIENKAKLKKKVAVTYGKANLSKISVYVSFNIICLIQNALALHYIHFEQAKSESYRKNSSCFNRDN